MSRMRVGLLGVEPDDLRAHLMTLRTLPETFDVAATTDPSDTSGAAVVESEDLLGDVDVDVVLAGARGVAALRRCDDAPAVVLTPAAARAAAGADLAAGPVVAVGEVHERLWVSADEWLAVTLPAARLVRMTTLTRDDAATSLLVDLMIVARAIGDIGRVSHARIEPHGYDVLTVVDDLAVRLSGCHTSLPRYERRLDVVAPTSHVRVELADPRNVGVGASATRFDTTGTVTTPPAYDSGLRNLWRGVADGTLAERGGAAAVGLPAYGRVLAAAATVDRR